jgi:hypothetical protein
MGTKSACGGVVHCHFRGSPLTAGVANSLTAHNAEVAGATPGDPDPVVYSTATDAPVTYPPDSMWGFLSTSAGTPSGAASIDDAIELSDLVAVGRYVGIERGSGYGAPGEGVGWYAIALIDVDVALRGDPRLGDDGLLRVPFLLALGVPGDEKPVYPEKEFADISRSIPKDPALLFLRAWSTYFARADAVVPDWLGELDRPDIYRTIGVDGAVRLAYGALTPSPFAETWVSSLDGLTVVGLGL